MAYTASAAAARALVARSALRPVASQIGAAKMDVASTQAAAGSARPRLLQPTRAFLRQLLELRLPALSRHPQESWISILPPSTLAPVPPQWVSLVPELESVPSSALLSSVTPEILLLSNSSSHTPFWVSPFRRLWGFSVL